MPWNDQIFRREVEAAATAAGKSPTAAYRDAGLGKSGTGTAHAHGPRIDLFEKLMPTLGWSPRDVLRVIAACFEWPGPEVVEVIEETIDGSATTANLSQTAPALSMPTVQAAKGEIQIFLKNIEVRVRALPDD